eukprot:scaffold313581_cov34-Attheya_sp.AAC.2
MDRGLMSQSAAAASNWAEEEALALMDRGFLSQSAARVVVWPCFPQKGHFLCNLELVTCAPVLSVNSFEIMKPLPRP